MRRMGGLVLDRVVSDLARVAEIPVSGDVDAAAFCRALDASAPEAGQPLPELLRFLFEDCVPRSFTTTSPGYLAYIPGGGLFPSALADLIAATTNRFTGMWQAAPALTQLEGHVIRWICDWMGLPDSAEGLLTSGGSQSMFTAIVTAREHVLGTELRRGTMYVSSHVHHCVPKAASLAGIFADRVRSVPVGYGFRMQVPALREAIERDRAAGFVPFLVVSSAGTTNTGAVDPMREIAAVAREQGLWHHVDAAYGGFFRVVPELHGLLDGLDEADSIALDPHKGFFLPYGTGALVVRDGATLRKAHTVNADYLPQVPEGEDLYDPSLIGPELSRPYRGLRMWLSIQLFGMKRLRAAIAEKREIAIICADAIGALRGIRMIARPQLSLFAFHMTWPGATLEQENAATRALIARVRQRGKIMCSGCVVDGRFLARVCVLSFRTRRATIDTCITHFAEEVERLLTEQNGSAAL